jgi:hypothetical protein
VSPADAELQTLLVGNLRASQRAWKQLSTAAAKHDNPAYKKAEKAIASAETDTQGTIRGLGVAGYSVG